MRNRGILPLIMIYNVWACGSGTFWFVDFLYMKLFYQNSSVSMWRRYRETGSWALPLPLFWDYLGNACLLTYYVNGKGILNEVCMITFVSVQNQADSCSLTWSPHFRLCILVLFEISKTSFWDQLFSEGTRLAACLILQTRI